MIYIYITLAMIVAMIFVIIANWKSIKLPEASEPPRLQVSWPSRATPCARWPRAFTIRCYVAFKKGAEFHGFMDVYGR